MPYSSVLGLLHLGQQPAHPAAARPASRFAKLLEWQFPLTTIPQRVRLRTVRDLVCQLPQQGALG